MRTVVAMLLMALGASAAGGQPARIEVPSGAEVWLQEVLTDRVPGMGLVQRYRFVMPSLAELVPPVPQDEMMEDLPPEMLDESGLSAEDQAALDDLGGIAIEGVPEEDAGAFPLPDFTHAPLPSELAAPDATLAAPEDEAAGDLAVTGDMPLPAAPDALMQDPVHRDILWLCQNYVLPRARTADPQPSQVVISMGSAPSEFGVFDPEVVQLFEGFSLPAGRDECVWEPM